jgi:hypothetical protein
MHRRPERYPETAAAVTRCHVQKDLVAYSRTAETLIFAIVENW